MIFNKKTILFLLLLSIAAVNFAQTPPTKPPKEVTKAENEAREKAEKAAKEKAAAEAKRKEDLKKLLERQAKAESSNKRISESAAASVNAKAEAFYTTAMSQINTKHVDWIKLNAKRISDKNLDELSVKVMADYYGKKEGLSETDTKGLTVLLVREAHKIGNKEYSSYSGPVGEVENKKMKLLEIREMLSDSSFQISTEQVDSINLILAETQQEEVNKKSDAPAMARNEKPEETTHKAPEQKGTLSGLALTKKKVEEKIEFLDGMYKEEAARMQEIKSHQQKMTFMLSKIVNDVAEAGESIIQNLK